MLLKTDLLTFGLTETFPVMYLTNLWRSLAMRKEMYAELPSNL